MKFDYYFQGIKLYYIMPIFILIPLTLMDQLNTARTAFWVGNYGQVLECNLSETPTTPTTTIEISVLKWKSQIKLTGEVSEAVSRSGVTSEPLKRVLLLWSKVSKSASSADIPAIQQIANENNNIEDEILREQILLLAAETLLHLSALDEAFNILKSIKSSNMDW